MRLSKKKIILPIKGTNSFRVNKDYFTVDNVKDNTDNIIAVSSGCTDMD